MTYRALFQGLTKRLLSYAWTGETQLLVEEIAAFANSTQPIKLKEQLVIESFMTDRPAIAVIDRGGSHQALGISNELHHEAILGIGLGNQGIVANEFVPHDNYSLNSDQITKAYSSVGEHGGESSEETDTNVLVRGRKFSTPQKNGYEDDVRGVATGIPGYYTGGTNANVPGAGIADFFHSIQTQITSDGGGSGETNQYGKIPASWIVPFDDTNSVVQDPTDKTKTMRIDVGAVSASTTRVLTMPNQDIDLTPDSGTFTARLHAARHERDGTDQIDGDHLDIDFNPANYTPTTTPAEAANVDDLTAHLAGIDEAFTFLTAGTLTTLTISSAGAIAPTQSFHTVAAETGTADELNTLTPDGDGKIVFLHYDTGDTITLKNSGNLMLKQGVDAVLASGRIEYIAFVFEAAAWYEVFRWSNEQAVHTGASTLYTIATGVITIRPMTSNIIVEVESGTADNLDTINGGSDGQVIVLRANDNAETVTCTESGNLILESAGNFSLDNTQDRIMFHYDGTNWCEVSRSNNSA